MEKFVVMSKRELMDELIAEIRVCRKCRLRSSAKNPVPGEGSLDASLMFIGEAPGYWEDIEGRPFVGTAGKLLDRLLTSVGLRRNEVFIGNIVKHRPPGNRDPRMDEIESCGPYLDHQIQIIRPEIIVTLGRYSTKYVLSQANVDFTGITEMRGRAYKKVLLNITANIVPTLHPAAALYNPKFKSLLEEDFQRIKTLLDDRY
jgi:uracil-DNA glycosylase family 4